jgi:hypothetical protein
MLCSSLSGGTSLQPTLSGGTTANYSRYVLRSAPFLNENDKQTESLLQLTTSDQPDSLFSVWRYYITKYYLPRSNPLCFCETIADSMLLSSLSVGTTLQPTICYAPLCLARLRLTICFISYAPLCLAVLQIPQDYLSFCQVRLR